MPPSPFDIAVDAATPSKLGLDLHLADCETARGYRATLACAECGRARWMHGTRHDTCAAFAWVTKHTVTKAQIRKLMEIDASCVDMSRQELRGLCERALGGGDGPAWVAKGMICGIINTAKNRVIAAHPPEPKVTRSTIGVGPHIAIRTENDDGTYQIQLELAGPAIGHGNTRRDAAKHLAAQLRELATMVSKIEGTPIAPIAPAARSTSTPARKLTLREAEQRYEEKCDEERGWE